MKAWQTWALAVGCVYEVFALASKGRVPTITRCIKWVGKQRGGRFLVWAWCGYITWHFLEEEAQS